MDRDIIKSEICSVQVIFYHCRRHLIGVRRLEGRRPEQFALRLLFFLKKS